MEQRPVKHDPYCEFKDDTERRNALISRDIRLVLVAIVVGLVGGPVAQAFRLWWFI